jgi:hypothetical protein
MKIKMALMTPISLIGTSAPAGRTDAGPAVNGRPGSEPLRFGRITRIGTKTKEDGRPCAQAW